MNTPSATPATLTVPGDAPVLRAFGEEVRLQLTGNQTGGKLTVWIEVTPPGGGPPPHYHLNEDEWFYVLEGRVAFFSGGEWREVGVGASAFMARGVIHTFKNVGDQPLRQLVSVSPSGFETFFARCAAEFSQPGGPDMPRIIQIAREHGIHFLEP